MSASKRVDRRPDPVEAVSVGELVRRRTGGSADPWQLALVQRNVVWDEVRMARLLDSLLAGYPIGGLLVCRVLHGGMVLAQTDDGREARPADEDVSQLIDGQQRVNALVCLFSDAGGFGRFFLDMTSPRVADEVVTRRRDKRTTIRYIRWSADGRFDDAPGEGERERFLDLSRLSEWADRVGGVGIETALQAVVAEPLACVDVLNDIDPEFADSLPPGALAVAAARCRRILDLWRTESIPVQHLVLEEPSDVLQVFTRINLEGVQVAGEDVFFAGVKTLWPAAEQTLHRVVQDIPLISRLTALRVLSRLASVQVDQGDMLPLRVDRLNGDKGQKVIRALESLVTSGPELLRMRAITSALIDHSGLGHALHLVDAQLYDHVLGWAAVNEAIENEAQLQDWLPTISSFLVGASAYRHLAVLRDTFSRLAFREALAAGIAGEPFPLERIVAASRRQWPELRVGQQSVQAGPVEVNGNARLFLSILQRLPFHVPPGREVEWDHIYPQALSSRMRWRGSDGQQRLQNHSKRGVVWHGANLWALDGALNLAASDLRPSAKFAFLAGLPSSDRRHPALWPDEGWLSDEERALLLGAERLIWEDQIDLGMNQFEAFVEGRAQRIRAAITAMFPTIGLFAADAAIDRYAFEDRPIPPQLIRVPLVLAPAGVDRAGADDTDDGLLSSDEIRAIAYEFLREKDPSRTIGEHYYDVLRAVEAVGRVGAGDPAPRMHGVLNNASGLFVSLGSGRFTWIARSESGRRYWVMRTDRGNRSALWGELAQGRLRQGWGWADDQDLRKLQAVARGGGVWTESQRAAARNRRMLSSEPNSIQIGDLIVVPHMPAEGRWSLARVIGAYEYGSADGWADYRHVLPVELLSGPGGIDPNRPLISRQLRSSLRNQNRMWNIDPVGPDVEAVVVASFASSTD
ncbi:MAG TPA: DUF262 domain-containing protein [Candidatus Limnocylindrales bacterium]|nr:DUF262 domain-containing protein [Candidatus Limnocylindrales bacterium]